MAFRTDQPLQQAFSAAISRAASSKAQLQRFAAALAGNITANDALSVSVSSATLASATFTPAQTAPLLTLVNDAVAAIS